MPKHTGRPWQRLRDLILERDAGICHICGQPGADSADHLTPRSLGGPDTPDNLAAVHHNNPPRCNRRRGNGTVNEARTRLAKHHTTPTTWDW